MWLDPYTAVCARHVDLVAVYESPRGRLALLLRHTLVPLAEERVGWLRETRGAVRRLLGDLRAAGFGEGVFVLQWLPLGEVAGILAGWPCRYVGDPSRQVALARLADRYLADRRFLASHAAECGRQDLADAHSLTCLALLGDARRALSCWYHAMAPRWLVLEPRLRRRLVLETHRWIAAQLLGASGAGQAPVAELGPEGKLGRTLEQLVPDDVLADWRPWIHRVLADLQRAFALPAAERNEAWGRWLFLIPYSVPDVPRPRGAGRAPGQYAEGPQPHGARAAGRVSPGGDPEAGSAGLSEAW
jgi:hypothetical protein